MGNNYIAMGIVYAFSLGSFLNDFYELNYTFLESDSLFNELNII